jgi:hypothetical protein
VTPPKHDNRGEPSSLDDWLMGFVRIVALRPVSIVVVGSFAALGAWILVLALRDRSPLAIAALALLALGTADLFQRDLRRRRFGPTARLATALWALSALAAASAVALGIA